MIIRDPREGSTFSVYKWDKTLPGNFSASRTFEPDDPIQNPNPDLPCGDPKISPAEHGCHLQSPGGYITVISPDKYHLAGDATDGIHKISWNLTYARRLARPWLLWVKWPVPRTLGFIPAWITYPMHMADAVVNGTFTTDEDTRDEIPAVVYHLVNAKGYHDGFYSKFVYSLFEWDWLDYKQDNLAIQLLHPHAPIYSCNEGWETCTPGNLRVVYHDGKQVKEYTFHRGKNAEEKQIWITYDTTATDPKYPDVKYPTQETIIALDEEGNRLEVHWTLVRYAYVYYDVPYPFKDTLSFEMIVQIQGSFYEANSKTTVPISGTAWADWCHPPFKGK